MSATLTLQKHPYDCPADPRLRNDFQPHYYPKANGKEAPAADAGERNDRILLEFLAAYYDLNCEYARLLEVRRGEPSPQRGEAERRRLQAIEKVLIVRDALEDRYAPLGVVTEPVVRDGFTMDVRIKFGNVDGAGRRRSDLYTLTTCVPVPMPPGLKFEDLPMKIEGPGFNGEY